MCAKVHIENLSCYFAAAAQIVQTVGAHAESAGLRLFVAIIWLFSLREMYRLPPTHLELCV